MRAAAISDADIFLVMAALNRARASCAADAMPRHQRAVDKYSITASRRICPTVFKKSFLLYHGRRELEILTELFF